MTNRQFSRTQRVSQLLREEIARLIQREVKDPTVGFVSVSDVEVSRDLSHARVYVTVFDEDQAKDSIRALKRAAGFLRRRLGQEMRLRSVPELDFRHDDSVETGQRMDALIERARASDPSGPDGDPEGRDERSEPAGDDENPA